MASPIPAEWTADLTTLMLAGSYLFFLHAHYLLTDIPFIALAWAAFYAALRAASGHGAWLILASVLSVAAITVRVPMLPFLALMAAGLTVQPLPKPGPVRQRWLAAAVLLASTAVTAAGWFFLGRSMGSLAYIESTSHYIAEFPTRAAGVAQALSANMSTLLISTDDVPLLGAIGWGITLLGMGVLWHRGLRLGLLVLVPYILTIAVSRRADIPDRYLLPVMPFIFLGILQGAGTLALYIARMRQRHNARQIARDVTILLAAAILLANSARIFKHGAQLAYLARTDRYDKDIQRGDLWEHMQIAERITHELPDGCQFLVEGGQGRIIHYLSRRTYVPLGLRTGERLDAAMADRIWGTWQKNPDIPLAVLPWPKEGKQPDYATRLGELFINQNELYRGKSTIVFQRTTSQEITGARRIGTPE